MSFEISGKLHKKFPTDQKSDRFQARDFVLLLDDEQYPQYIKFQLTQDRCDLIEKYSEGQNIKVHFDLRGREWNEKYFTNLNAWRIEPGEGTQAVPDEANFPDLSDEVSFDDDNSSSENEMDDLPF
jgi:hypothetical protein